MKIDLLQPNTIYVVDTSIEQNKRPRTTRLVQPSTTAVTQDPSRCFQYSSSVDGPPSHASDPFMAGTITQVLIIEPD